MTKNTKVLIVLFILLAGASYYYLRPTPERETSYKSADMNLTIDSVSVSKIEIQKPGKSITLENTDGKWFVTFPGKYPANVSNVTQLIGGMKKFKVGSLISSNPLKQNQFQVDSTGTKLTLTNRSGKSVSLVVGKNGPSYTDIYFRLPDSKDVYLGDGLSPWMFNQELKDWRDKTIFKTTSDSIKQLSFVYKSNNVTLQRDSTKWRISKPASAKASAGMDTISANEVTSALNTLANLNAEDFIDPAYTPTTNPLSVKVQTGEEAALNFFPMPPDSAKYAVQTSQSQQTYVMSKWTVQQVMKPVERLLK